MSYHNTTSFLIHREEKAGINRFVSALMVTLIIGIFVLSAITAENASIAIDPVTRYQKPVPPDDGYNYDFDPKTTTVYEEFFSMTLGKRFFLRCDGLLLTKPEMP